MQQAFQKRCVDYVRVIFLGNAAYVRVIFLGNVDYARVIFLGNFMSLDRQSKWLSNKCGQSVVKSVVVVGHIIHTINCIHI